MSLVHLILLLVSLLAVITGILLLHLNYINGTIGKAIDASFRSILDRLEDMDRQRSLARDEIRDHLSHCPVKRLRGDE